MKRILICILIVGLLLGLAGCIDDGNKKTVGETPKATTDKTSQITDKTPQATDKKVQKNIDFDISAQGDRSNYSENKSRLYVITSEKEFTGLNLETEPKFNISDIDFQTDLIAIILLGERPNSGYVLNIKEITQTDNSVDIFASVDEPIGGIDVVTSPYVIIKIKKSEIAEGTTIFRFFLNDVKITEQTVNI